MGASHVDPCGLLCHVALGKYDPYDNADVDIASLCEPSWSTFPLSIFWCVFANDILGVVSEGNQRDATHLGTPFFWGGPLILRDQFRLFEELSRWMRSRVGAEFEAVSEVVFQVLLEPLGFISFLARQT